MTYQYVSAMTRSTRETVDWVATDLSQQTLMAILNNYFDVYIQLSDQISTGPLYLTKDGLRQAAPHQAPGPTLTAWLAGLGNASLPTVTEPPSITATPVEYADAWQAGWVGNLSDASKAVDYPGPDASKPDVLLSKTGIDPANMSQFVLTTINGYLHYSQGSPQGIYAMRGGVTARLSNDNHAGILSFLKVGPVQQIPITADMLYKTNPNQKYSQSVYVKLPVSLTGKTLLLSIGGYLHVLDGTYSKINDNAVKVNFRLIPFPERIYQSRTKIDLSSLPLETGAGDNGQFSVESIYSDEVIAAYMTLSQSFAIVVDSANFYSRKWYLERSVTPGRYFSNLYQRFPLIGTMGRIWDYRLSKEEDTYVYGCDSIEYPHHLFSTADYLNQLSVVGIREPSRPWTNGKGYLLEFGGYS